MLDRVTASGTNYAELPPLPDEEARIAALHALGLLDSPPQERFDRITRLTSLVLGVPIALVNLIDRDRQVSLSCVGLPGDDVPRAQSFCAHAIARDEPLVIPDLARDARFSASPFVTGPAALRFYAGEPITGAGGHRLGTLCICDVRPRHLDEAQLGTLRDLARLVEREISADALTEALAARHAAERRTRAVMDSAAEGIFTTAADGAIDYVNPAARRILGLVTGDAIGRPLPELIVAAGVTADTRSDEMAQLLRAGSRGTAIATLKRFDTGEEVPIEYTTAPIGAGEGIVVTFRDVTERRQLERLREQFVATVSHELRTPLASITGYVEVLADGLAGPLNEQQRTHLAAVARSAGRLDALVQDLLTLAEAEAPAHALARAPVDVAALAQDVAAELAPLARDKDVKVELDAAGAEIAGDERRLRRLLLNVAGNAVKFSPAGGAVALRAWPAAGGGAIVEVADAGPGIPADELPLVSTRFFRASTGAATPGTGLGLAIACEIAEQHGGRLEVDSAVGEGTTVRVTLPARPPAA